MSDNHIPQIKRNLPAERRSCNRLGFDCPVRWNKGGVDRYGWARDVSDRNAGFTVRALSAPAAGDTIQLVFELSSDHEWLVDERAVVTRCEAGQAGVCHVGVELSKLPFQAD